MGLSQVQGPDPAPDPWGIFGPKSRTQIVHSRGLNFHAVPAYLEMVKRNDLAEKVGGAVLGHRTAAGEEALLVHEAAFHKL
jgi:hypothetical protein